MEGVFNFDEKTEIIFKPAVDFVEKMMYYDPVIQET